MTASKSAQVGLRDLYVAVLTDDSATGTTYETPVKLAPAVQASISPQVETATDYGDDGPVETASSLSGIEVEIETTQFTVEQQALVLGHKYEGGLLVRNSGDVAPYVALGFRSEKADGSYLYVWLYKGKFQPAEMQHQTKGENVEFQHPTIQGTFVKREFDDNWMISGDSSDTTFQWKDAWFQQVVEPGSTPPPEG